MCILQYRALFASATFYTKYCVILENHCNGVKCCFLCVCIHSRGEGNAPHSSTLAWKISWTEESGRLQSMGSIRVRHDWATSLSLFTFMHWRRKWQSHSIVPAWRIPRTWEPGGLPSMGSHRVGHDWSDLAAAAATTYTVEIVSYITINLFKDSSNILCSPKLRHYWSLHRKIISFMLICALPNLYSISSQLLNILELPFYS